MPLVQPMVAALRMVCEVTDAGRNAASQCGLDKQKSRARAGVPGRLSDRIDKEKGMKQLSVHEHG